MYYQRVRVRHTLPDQSPGTRRADSLECQRWLAPPQSQGRSLAGVTAPHTPGPTTATPWRQKQSDLNRPIANCCLQCRAKTGLPCANCCPGRPDQHNEKESAVHTPGRWPLRSSICVVSRAKRARPGLSEKNSNRPQGVRHVHPATRPTAQRRLSDGVGKHFRSPADHGFTIL